MKAISLWEPWASAMMLGLKCNETRHWPTSYRGDLVICSAKQRMTQQDSELAENWIRSDFLPVYGAALCVVDLYDCVSANEFLCGLRNVTELEYAFGNYTYGRFIWLTRNRRIVKRPVPVIGRQAFWNLDEATEFCLRTQLALP